MATQPRIAASHRVLRRCCWLAAGVAVAFTALELSLRLTPLPSALRQPLPVSVEFVDREQRPLRSILVDQQHYARRVQLSDINRSLIDATISAEDKRFRSHPGIDVLALARAVRSLARDGHASSGASTLTQQLLKLTTPGPRTALRKIAEIWGALSLERRWSKDQILEEYLNRLDYGNLQVGIASASRFYLGKPPADLSPGEAAFLAGLPKAPSRLEPHSHHEAARGRQQWVLRRMLANGCLDPAAAERAAAEPIQLLTSRHEFEAPHFVDLLLQRTGVMTGQPRLIATTLDLQLNRYAESCLAERLFRIRDKHATSGAVVIIHNPTGEVLALAGSGDYFQPGVGQINGAWSARSPGSAVKPFTYLLALQQGANPCSIVADVPTEFSTPTGVYAPNNYNHRFYGPVSLRFALGNSLNVAAVRTLESAGGPEVLHRTLRELGFTTLSHGAEYYGPGLTLGNAEVRLLELTNAFATIARLGVHRSYRLLRKSLDSGEPRQLFDPRAAYAVADMLSDNSARAASFGLESFLSFDFPVACKTGTSSDYRDNWALGFTPEFTVGVWVGNPDGSPMRGITGVTGAAPVLHDLFEHLHNQRGTSWYSAPAGIQSTSVHPLTGHSVSPTRPDAVVEKCIWQPVAEQRSDYDEQGRVLLDQHYAAWIASPQNSLGDLIACKTAADLRITSPTPGTVFFVDPDMPASTQRIALKADAVGSVEWSTDLALSDEGGAKRLQLDEGVHVISARDTRSGRSAATWIDVRKL